MFTEWDNVDHIFVYDVVIQQLYFLACVHVFAFAWVCRFSCCHDKWQPDIGLKGRAAQLDYCLCPFYQLYTFNTHMLHFNCISMQLMHTFPPQFPQFYTTTNVQQAQKSVEIWPTVTTTTLLSILASRHFVCVVLVVFIFVFYICCPGFLLEE